MSKVVETHETRSIDRWAGVIPPLENGDRLTRESVEPDAAGVLRSEVFPGLRLDSEAMVDCDIARVLDDLRTGLATPEHAAVVEHLAVAGPD